MPVLASDISAAIKQLALSKRPICVHSSLRSFGWVEGGAAAIIEGMLAEGCTIVVPTFSWDTFKVTPPLHLRPQRNGVFYAELLDPGPGQHVVFTQDSTAIDREMGKIPAAVLAHQKHVRGNHPLCSFTAVGPLATEIIQNQQPLDVFEPLQALIEHGGAVLLMGVGFEELTLIHLAEQLAGRRLFRRWANGVDQVPIEVAVGGCSNGFGKFDSLLQQLGSRTEVGQSRWFSVAADQAVAVCTQAIEEDPNITHCRSANCERCNDATLGGPLVRN